MKRIYLAAAAGLLALLSMSPGALCAATLEAPISLTIDQPVAVQNTVLLPGTYLVKPVDNNSSAGIVMIYDETGEHRIATSVFTNVERHPGDPETSGFSLYEAAPGNVSALRDVFASGEDLGIEFPAPR